MSLEDDAKPARATIPPQIKKNTLLLAVIQALVATGFQLIPSLGGLIMLRFTESLAFVGLTLSIGSIARPVMAYPAGMLADARGRKPRARPKEISSMSGNLVESGGTNL